ncbi:unnamed protein product [Bursaphelenchus xylophilus]|uniref:(pine wood nematode) hypothetical protein n=1 Tax=Bursaphelenchus xylophilus TaxID=6326 RepID=A0A1I7RXN4_BURXY|nr:unnamed protein product [Bursaphelenchus xylophilus]CAG9126612.1 unnamed protein product [Bursaphelenchus xylophilus]
MFSLALFTLLTLKVHALPVIFGYHSGSKSDYQVAKHPTDADDNALFVAGFNKPLKRPMSVHGDAVAYNVDEKDLPNFIPADANKLSTTSSTPIDKDIHPSYREVVTRSTRGHEYLVVDEKTENSVEECYGNAKLLPRKTVRKMNKKRRKLAQAIRRLNKLQRSFCLKKRMHEDGEKCAEWRTEKMALYVKLMQLTHCITPTVRPSI